ncbi:hypothetical protein [Streptacidiphilus jiangxiensis]|uniref:Serine/threonine protein kinase n=1 Tax=Streptacidiphilus jiangxiensis TaxID=235985 RepID=A0A1H7TJV8_STRJI|nr:hypothetical protein [Streptacidiphilus jiangxiensis]SEL84968.1 hypothetical protein SAMN05414137_11425 [Streptacidiphilus jiangxiensis]
MRSATRRATVAATAVTAVLLLGACSQTAADAGAGSGTTTAGTAPSASGSTPSGDPGTGTGDSSSAAPTVPAVPTHSAPAAPASLPVLGAVWASGVRGYGTARPSGLDNGGDPTGIVTGLTWSSWGGSSADGTGTAEYVAPGQSVAQGSEERAKVVAFDLGTCHGKTAYRAIEWYFPGKGQHFSTTHYFDACTGQDHGM